MPRARLLGVLWDSDRPVSAFAVQKGPQRLAAVVVRDRRVVYEEVTLAGSVAAICAVRRLRQDEVRKRRRVVVVSHVQAARDRVSVVV